MGQAVPRRGRGSAAAAALALLQWAYAERPHPESALAQARALLAEQPQSDGREGAEYDGHDWWERHESTLSAAWAELGAQHPELLAACGSAAAFDELFIPGQLQRAAQGARDGLGEGAVRQLLRATAAPGVWALEAVTGRFAAWLAAELRHRRAAGIPIRRPNGMNRYGAILEDVGLGAPVRMLVERYIRPIALMLFPEIAGPGDADEHFAFSVRYATGEDTDLARHTDASVVTFNLCLGEEGFTGGEVFFDEVGYAAEGGGSGNRTAVALTPGVAIFHRGAHAHGALPLLSGARENLIVWLTARWGVVRVVEYPPEERTSPEQRWGGGTAPTMRAAEL
eukprot:TRINITY_DN56448_c0_g1_i1.p2 TRINITY_DN56448_c0_g1~~TRINITY_DN56448_c0_g1_i1.p2  ORF type:complete len:368 (+),score=91.96 TRINITY_DN56448_c0_g1_i1:89-1105(+)